MHTRREFLRVVGCGLSMLMLPALPSGIASGQEADFPELGFRVRIPGGWRFLGGSEVDERYHAARARGGSQARVAALSGTPLLLALREPVDMPQPTAVFWRQPSASDHHAADDASGFARVHWRTYRRYLPLLKDSALMGPAEAVVFAGRPASRVEMQFCETHDTGLVVPVHLTSYMFRWDPSWMTCNFVRPASHPRRGIADFAAIERALGLYEAR